MTSLSYTTERAKDLTENINSVLSEIDSAYTASGSKGPKPRLVPISKIKPASDIKALYDAGHRHFGENYIQEMVDKASILPSDIKWHFVGALQSNKAKLAASVPNLYMIETVSSQKLADLLEKHRETPLNIYLQVNTSSEESKAGLPALTSDSGELVDLALHIINSCPKLRIAGLMTIGSYEASHDESKPNPDFTCLKRCRELLVEALQRVESSPIKSVNDLELSMGMSADFVQAVKEGSGSVRVGTRIFGERPKK